MKKLSILFVLALGGLWGLRAIHANAQEAQPQYRVSPNLFQDGQNAQTTCEFYSFGTFTRLICDRRELEPCDCNGNDTSADSDAENPRAQLVRRGCRRDAEGVAGLRPGEIQVVRGGRTEVISTRKE